MKIERPIYRTTSPLSTNKALYKNETMLTFGWKLPFLYKNKAKMANKAKNVPPTKDETIIDNTLEYAGWSDISKYLAGKFGFTTKTQKNKKKKP